MFSRDNYAVFLVVKKKKKVFGRKKINQLFNKEKVVLFTLRKVSVIIMKVNAV